MEKFELDYKSLSNVVDPDTSRIPLKGNEHRIIRVAFDMVRFKDSGPEELWQIQSNDDGEFLVRTFDIGDEENVVTSNWKVMLDKKEENITVAYQNIPIKRVACKEYGATNTKEAWMLRDTIYERLNSDQKFIRSFYFSLPSDKQAALKEIVAWDDFTAEEIKSILEQSGGSVEYRPTTHGFSYLTSYPNGYKLSSIPYGEGMGDVSVKEEPLEGERWDSVECMVKDAEGKDVNPRMIGVSNDEQGVFIVDVSELAAVGKRLGTLEYGSLPMLEQPHAWWDEYDEEDEAEASDQWAMANHMIRLKKHAVWPFGEKEKEPTAEEILEELDLTHDQKRIFIAYQSWSEVKYDVNTPEKIEKLRWRMANAIKDAPERAFKVWKKEMEDDGRYIPWDPEYSKEPSSVETGESELGIEETESECMEPGLLAADQWSLAFLDLELSKMAEDIKTCLQCGSPKELCECICPKCGDPGKLCKCKNCPKCGKSPEGCMCPKCNICGGSPGECDCVGIPVKAADDLCLSKRSMCGQCEQKVEDKDEELLEKAYYALEHYLDPGSEEAVDLSGLIYDVEAGSGNVGMLRRMVEELEEREEAKEEEPDEEGMQLVDEPEGVPLSFRELAEEEQLEPGEELSFEEEEEKPGAERIDEILDDMRDIKHRLRRQDTPENEKSILREKLNELKMELADIAESEFGTKKPTHLYHSKGFSKSEFLPTAEEYFEELEADDE